VARLKSKRRLVAALVGVSAIGFILWSSPSHAQTGETTSMYPTVLSTQQSPIPYGLNPGFSSTYSNPFTTYGSNNSPFENGTGNQSNQQNQTGNADNTKDQGGAPAVAPAPIAGGKAKAKAEASGHETSVPKANPASESEPLAGSVLRGQPRALTGDTLTFGNGAVHLSAVSAPALDAVCRKGATAWRCGEDSRQQLQSLIDERPVECIVLSTGMPSIAACRVGSDNLSAMLVERGSVFPADGYFKVELAAAKSNELGIWALGGR
jgi:endonuclease YncB( thermonuclease family)